MFRTRVNPLWSLPALHARNKSIPHCLTSRTAICERSDKRLYATIRAVQPGARVSICGTCRELYTWLSPIAPVNVRKEFAKTDYGLDIEKILCDVTLSVAASNGLRTPWTFFLICAETGVQAKFRVWGESSWCVVVKGLTAGCFLDLGNWIILLHTSTSFMPYV